MDDRARELERAWRASKQLPDWIVWARHVHRFGFHEPLTFYRSATRFLARVRRTTKVDVEMDRRGWGPWRTSCEALIARLDHAVREDARRVWRALATLHRLDLSPALLLGPGAFEIHQAISETAKIVETRQHAREARRDQGARETRARTHVVRGRQGGQTTDTADAVAMAAFSTIAPRPVRCPHWHTCGVAATRWPAASAGWTRVGTAFVCPFCSQGVHSLGTPVRVLCDEIDHEGPAPSLLVEAFDAQGEPPRPWGRTAAGRVLCPDHFSLLQRS